MRTRTGAARTTPVAWRGPAMELLDDPPTPAVGGRRPGRNRGAWSGAVPVSA
ncbi:hypothetical protein [Streptomyces rubiginosohelvolus]